jgi:hypothetical protein
VAQSYVNSVDIGQVFGDAARALRQNWAVYLILSVVLVGVPAAIATTVVDHLVAQHVLSKTTFGGGFLIGYARSAPVGLASLVLQGAIIAGSRDFFSGRRASLSDGLMAGLRSWGPLWLLNLLRSLALIGGYLLLIVPGVIMNIAWYVAGPVQVIEGGSPIASLQRSAELTRGRRWAIFGVAIIVLVFQFVVGLLTGFVGGFAVGFLRHFAVPMLSPEAFAYALYYPIAYTAGSAVAAALYHQLNRGQGEDDALVQVFA